MPLLRRAPLASSLVSSSFASSSFASSFTSALALLALAGFACAPGDGGEGEGEAGEGEGDVLVEEEDNSGTPESAVNALPLGATMTGAIATPGDADVFHLTGSTPGHLYRATLTAHGSLDGHLTILDDGRSGDFAGNDYLRLHRAPDGQNAVVEFAALGGGVYVIVRDARDVDGDSVGAADATYELVVTDVTDDVTGAALAVPGDIDGVLGEAGSVAAFPFTVDAGSDIVLDVDHAPDVDLRAFVVSLSTGDWIARNEDRAFDDIRPLIDAPLFEEGPYVLLLENAAEGAPVASAFHVQSSVP